MKQFMTLVATLVLVGGLLCGNAFSLTLAPNPDIFVSGSDFTFDGTLLSATGFASEYKKKDGTSADLFWNFNLSATFSGNSFVSGSFTLLDGPTSQLAGTLTSGSFVSDIFSFLFTPTDGALQGDWGSQGGIILSTASGTGDIGAPVPEPSTWILLAAGLGVLAARQRRSKQGG